MKTFQPVLTTSVVAAVDIEKYRFIGFDGDYCGADQKALGVSEVDVSPGEQCSVICEGIALVVAGGAIAQGKPVTSDANGQAVEATSATVTIPSGTAEAVAGTYNVDGGVLPQAINGYALDAAAGAGEIIRVKLV